MAAKLEADPTLLEVARTNLSRWLQLSPAAALIEWHDLLQVKSVPQVIALLRSTDEESRRLRQSSPFAGVLTPAERDAILRQYESTGP